MLLALHLFCFWGVFRILQVSGSFTARLAQIRSLIISIHTSLLRSLRTQTPGRLQIRMPGSRKLFRVLSGSKTSSNEVKSDLQPTLQFHTPCSGPFLSFYGQWEASSDFLLNSWEKGDQTGLATVILLPQPSLWMPVAPNCCLWSGQSTQEVQVRRSSSERALVMGWVLFRWSLYVDVLNTRTSECGDRAFFF